MKTALNLFLTVSLGAGVLLSGCAQPKSAAPTSPAAAKPAPPAGEKSEAPVTAKEMTLTNLPDRTGYAIGMNVGENLKRSNFDVNLDEIMNGMRDVVAGHETKITGTEARAAIVEYQRKRQQDLAEKNAKLGAAFMAENKTKPGVRILWVLFPDGRREQMQYRIITEGAGAKPGSNDVVSVNYRGTLLNGKEFDSSARYGKAAKLPMGSVIRGWQEALKFMEVGSKWELFIPPDLAYGEAGRPPTIEPNSTLIFEVELVDTETPQPPKPVTSDIIRVPSADEMKAGAKVEVIKAEDAEKAAASQSSGTNTNKN